jgi:hypothetical protein
MKTSLAGKRIYARMEWQQDNGFIDLGAFFIIVMVFLSCIALFLEIAGSSNNMWWQELALIAIGSCSILVLFYSMHTPFSITRTKEITLIIDKEESEEAKVLTKWIGERVRKRLG